MSPEEQVAHLTQYLPALGEIQDPKTAQAVAQVWFSALEMSPWVSFEQAKFKEGMDHVSLISHVNSSVECALALARIIHKYHGCRFDEQRIITLGLLHDVDKVVQYVYDDAGQLVVSELGRKTQHGFLTAMLAREAGFDVDMQHLIITHTHDQNMKPLFREGILFNYADLCDWEMTCKFSENQINVK